MPQSTCSSAQPSRLCSSHGLTRPLAAACRRHPALTDALPATLPPPPWPAAFGPAEFAKVWARELRRNGLRVQIWPACGAGNLSRIGFAAVFDPPAGLLARCPNLKAIHSMGAGVSPGMLEGEVCPTHLPLLRVVDPLMAQRMATFALWAVINCQRKW